MRLRLSPGPPSGSHRRPSWCQVERMPLADMRSARHPRCARRQVHLHALDRPLFVPAAKARGVARGGSGVHNINVLASQNNIQ